MVGCSLFHMKICLKIRGFSVVSTKNVTAVKKEKKRHYRKKEEKNVTTKKYCYNPSFWLSKTYIKTHNNNKFNKIVDGFFNFERQTSTKHCMDVITKGFESAMNHEFNDKKIVFHLELQGPMCIFVPIHSKYSSLVIFSLLIYYFIWKDEDDGCTWKIKSRSHKVLSPNFPDLFNKRQKKRKTTEKHTKHNKRLRWMHYIARIIRLFKMDWHVVRMQQPRVCKYAYIPFL